MMVKIMTVIEFFASVGGIAIHCDTEEKAKTLLKAFDNAGYKWRDGNRYTYDSYWKDYLEATCYSNGCMYGSREFYQDINYKILEFEEIEI